MRYFRSVCVRHVDEEGNQQQDATNSSNKTRHERKRVPSWAYTNRPSNGDQQPATYE